MNNDKTMAQLMEELQQHVEQIKADIADGAFNPSRKPRVWFSFWDTRTQYRPEKGFMPRFGKVFEIWGRGWGEPRLQITLEAGHRRFWHKPRIYDLNSDCTQWVKCFSGCGVSFAVAARPLRKYSCHK